MGGGANVLSLKGQIRFAIEGQEDTINETKRLLRDQNAAGNAIIREGQKKRGGIFKEGLKEIEGAEAKSAQQLISNKKASAQRMESVRTAARPKPLTGAAASDTGAVKKRESDIKSLVNTAKSGHAALKKLLQDTGADVFKGEQWSAEEFMGAGPEQQKVVMTQRKNRVKDINAEVKANERLLKTMPYSGKNPDGKSNREAYNKVKNNIVELNKEKAHHNRLSKLESEGYRENIVFQRQYDSQQKESGRARGRLFAKRSEDDRVEKQMARDMRDLNRDVTEEYVRVKQEVGEGLRNAFTYATVAIAAFWYKLMPVVETFQEFERELINAQSIWQESNDVLFELSDQVVQFGQNFGINMGKATEGLYQYASAGVEAADAMNMLNHTLTLSMAVQGDHNTLAKLTTQTIMGFNMEFSDAAMVTDKFAHAINKSLIEWDDLASSVKFALPFFISTGQSLDQLLGALAVLTNRALEAGIAGRGLRQALAEFTQHAEDNSAAFHKMGIEILDVDGNMRELTDIAKQFQDQLGDGVKSMDIMMALMEDLNIRGATAFVHLVQNADEFQKQVDDLANSAGAAAEMAEIQQESLAMQIQLVKNALQAPFIMSEDMGENQEYLNSFAAALHGMVEQFENLIVVEKDGQKVLTEFGEFVRNFVIVAMQELEIVMELVVNLVKEFGKEGEAATNMLSLFSAPLKIVIKLLTALGPTFLKTVLLYKLYNKILPISTMNMMADITMRMVHNRQQMIELEMRNLGTLALYDETYARWIATQAVNKQNSMMLVNIGLMMASKIAMFGMIIATEKLAKGNRLIAFSFGAIAGAVMSATLAMNAYKIARDAWKTGWNPYYIAGAIVVSSALIMGAFNTYMASAMEQSAVVGGSIEDTGGRMIQRPRQYASGGRVAGRHFPVMVEAGETIIPKTQNMLGGGASGITINISGDVYDGDNFAEKIGEALPYALRKQSDIGGI